MKIFPSFQMWQQVYYIIAADTGDFFKYNYIVFVTLFLLLQAMTSLSTVDYAHISYHLITIVQLLFLLIYITFLLVLVINRKDADMKTSFYGLIISAGVADCMGMVATIIMFEVMYDITTIKVQ